MKKIGVIFFHKNVKDLYEERWIDKCINSIYNQSYKNIHIYEIDYGQTNTQLTSGKFLNISTKNHADAMNLIIGRAFEDGCDYVFNTNLDDYYDNKRIESQLEFLNNGHDIVSSDFDYVDENDNFILHKNILQFGDIKKNLLNNHNVIAHPCVAYSKKFWQDEKNRYVPEEKPFEDLKLWQRSIIKNYKFHICKEILLHYRIHNKQITFNKADSFRD